MDECGGFSQTATTTTVSTQAGNNRGGNQRITRRKVTVATITAESVAKGGVTASDLLRDGAASGQLWLINDRMYDREALVRQMQGMAGRGQDDALCELGAQCWTNKALFPGRRRTLRPRPAMVQLRPHHRHRSRPPRRRSRRTSQTRRRRRRKHGRSGRIDTRTERPESESTREPHALHQEASIRRGGDHNHAWRERNGRVHDQ